MGIFMMRAILTATLAPALALATPSCPAPGIDVDDDQHDWASCNSDPNAWYGLSKSYQNWNYAVAKCQAAGAELLVISSEEIDTCAFNVMDANNLRDEMVLFAGRYYPRSGWVWCPNLAGGTPPGDGCTLDMSGYKNFLSTSTTYGNCMGGYASSGVGFDGYGWIMRDCSEIVVNQVRAICRYDCGDSEPVHVENTVAMKSEKTADLTFYAVDGDFSVVQSTVVPYETKAPYMVWNYEINQLEVFGDWRTAPRTPHQASLHHYYYSIDSDTWTDNTANMLYQGENQGVAVYTFELGTILLNGWDTNKQFVSNVYQVTIPAGQQAVKVPDLPVAMDNFGAKYYDGKIYVGGGYYQEPIGVEFYPTSLYYMDCTNYDSWTPLAPLSKPGMPLEIEIFDGILYAFNGISDKEVYNVGVETYDLQTGETQYIDNVLNFGRYHGAFILTNSQQGSVISGNPTLTLVGGQLYPDCHSNASYSCNAAEQGAVGFKSVNQFSLIDNSKWQAYENNYIASAKFVKMN